MPMRCLSASKLVWGLAIGVLILPLGCASWRRDSSASQSEVTTIKPHPRPKGTPALAQATAAKRAAPKAGTEVASAAQPSAVDSKALQEVLAGMDELDPPTRQKMLNQLAESDPALLGPILGQWKAIIAAKKKGANRGALVKSGVQTTEPATLQPTPKPEPLGVAGSEASRDDDVLQPQKLKPAETRERETGSGSEAGVKLAKLSPADAEPGANQPSGLTTSKPSRPQGGSWQSLLGDAISQAEQQRASASPGNVQNEVYLRLMQMAHGDTEKALSPIPGSTPTEQEFWQKTLWAMSNYMDQKGIPEASDRAAEAVLHLNEAANRLRASATLQVKNLALCRKIMSYGSFEKFPEYEFAAGQPVLLYAEVDNFTSQQTPQGYKTVLKSSLEIQDLQGKQVWPQEFKATEDVCRNQRRDYFHSYQFTIPAKMTAGTYVLKLAVEDEPAHKVAEGNLRFSVK